MTDYLFKRKTLIVSSLIGLLLFALSYMLILNGSLQFLDKKISEFFLQVHSNFIDQLFIIITYLNNFESIVIFSIFISIYLIKRKRYRVLRFYFFTIIVATISTYFLKISTLRDRPDDGLINLTSYSFPSWHATLSVVLSFLVFMIFIDNIKNELSKKLFMTVVFIWPLLIGFSRIYLNVHWLSDVLAGWGQGLFIVTLSALFFKFFNEKSTSKL